MLISCFEAIDLIGGYVTVWRMACATSNLRLPAQPQSSATPLGRYPFPILPDKGLSCPLWVAG